MVEINTFLAGLSRDMQQFFVACNNKDLVYHNFQHTQLVVQHAAEIAAHHHLQEDELLILFTAAWFHDAGHLIHIADNHESISIALMKDYCSKRNIDAALIDQVAECIAATRLPQSPHSPAAEILCDADLYHLGTEDFLRINDLVKKEIESREKIELHNWDQSALSFLQSHQYYTSYCIALLNAGKEININLLKQRLSLTITSK